MGAPRVSRLGGGQCVTIFPPPALIIKNAATHTQVCKAGNRGPLK